MARPARVSPDRILAAAAVEFAARGYAGARVDRIARRARVNKAMLYYHFRSKQGLYRALLRADLQPRRRSARAPSPPPTPRPPTSSIAPSPPSPPSSTSTRTFRHHAARDRGRRRPPRRRNPRRARRAAAHVAGIVAARRGTQGASVPCIRSPPISACSRRSWCISAGAPIREQLVGAAPRRRPVLASRRLRPARPGHACAARSLVDARPTR